MHVLIARARCIVWVCLESSSFWYQTAKEMEGQMCGGVGGEQEATEEIQALADKVKRAIASSS